VNARQLAVPWNPASPAPEPRDAAVVVCTRDRAELLEGALRALADAVSRDVEIIVVDSGSTNARTREIAKRAGVTYVRSDTPGLSIARNIGLTATTREYIVFTDDDCVATAGFLPPLLAPFAGVDVGAAAGTLRDVSATSAEVASGEVELLRGVTAGLDAGHGALMAFRRSALLELGGFDPVLGAGRRFGGAEDMDAFCRILHAGLTVARVPMSSVTHINTRSDEDYVALSENYGRGIGAMCAKWLRVAPADGFRLSAVVARRGLSRLLRRLRTRRGRAGQLAYLRSLWTGYREARRLTLDGWVFTDPQPPVPVVLNGETPTTDSAAKRTIA